MSDFIKQNGIETKFKLGEPWTILSKIEQSIKDKIEKYGTPLGKWPNIKINYGIKTGLNEAFIVDEKTRNTILDECITEDERKLSDKLIRPILRGKDVKQGSYSWAGFYIILAYFNSHKFIPNDCPALYNHLLSHKTKLMNRGQCKYLSSGKTRSKDDENYPGYPGMHHWLELDNCPSKEYLDDFNNQVIAWQRITQRNNFCITQKGMLILDSMAFLSCDSENIDSLFKVLTSQLFYYWMTKNVHEYGESGFRLSNQYVQEFSAPTTKIKDECEIYEYYHLTKEEISYIKMIK